jgi:hypothetical protein
MFLRENKKEYIHKNIKLSIHTHTHGMNDETCRKYNVLRRCDRRSFCKYTLQALGSCYRVTCSNVPFSVDIKYASNIGKAGAEAVQHLALNGGSGKAGDGVHNGKSNTPLAALKASMCVYMYVCVCVYVHNMHVCIHYVYVYVCVCVYVYVYIYI